MAENTLVQTIRDAEIDARSLSEFVSKNASFTVTRRLAPTIHTLDYYLSVLNEVKEKGDLADIAISDTLDKLDQLEPTVIQRVEDAINNTAIEGGVLADTFVTVTPTGVGAVARTQRDVNSDIISVNNFGADNSGEQDSTAAIQAALNHGKLTGTKVVANGTYKITETIHINSSADFSSAIFEFYGTGSAICVSGSTERYISYESISLPQEVRDMSKYDTTGVGWSNESTGVEVQSANGCRIFFGLVHSFKTGLLFTSHDTPSGCAYNDFHLSGIVNCQRSLVIQPQAGGWVNENNFFGGRFAQFSSEGQQVEGVRQIAILAGTDSQHLPNGNMFYKPSLEGTTPEYHVENQGAYNGIIGARWEVGGGRAKVLYKRIPTHPAEVGMAIRNFIRDGYQADNIKFTYEGTRGATNKLEGAIRHEVPALGNDGLQINNSGSASGARLSTYNSYDAISDIPSEQYTFQVRGTSTGWKSPADVKDKVSINHTYGTITFTRGNEDSNYVEILSTKVKNVGESYNSLSISNGNLIAEQNGMYSLGLFQNRFRVVYLSAGIGFHGANPPSTQPTVTGSLTDGTALKSLLVALDACGLVKDSSTN